MAMKQSTIDKYKLVIDEWFINGFNGTKAHQSIYVDYGRDASRNEFPKLLAIPCIIDYVEEKHENIKQSKGITHESLVDDLIEIKERCMQRSPIMKFDSEAKRMVQAQDEHGNNVWTFDASNAVKSVVELGKHTGFYEVDNKQKNPESIIKAKVKFVRKRK